MILIIAAGWIAVATANAVVLRRYCYLAPRVMAILALFGPVGILLTGLLIRNSRRLAELDRYFAEIRRLQQIARH